MVLNGPQNAYFFEQLDICIDDANRGGRQGWWNYWHQHNHFHSNNQNNPSNVISIYI